MFQAIYYLIIIAICFLIGSGIVILLGQDTEDGAIKSVPIGAAMLMIICYWSSVLIRNVGTDITCTYIIIGLIIAIMITCILKRNATKAYFLSISKTKVLTILICVIAGLTPMMLRVFFNSENPYVDGYTYICNAEYLRSSSISTLIDFNGLITSPWLSQTYLYQVRHFRIGTQMMLAFFSSAFNVKNSIDMFSPLMGLGVYIFAAASISYLDVKERKKMCAILVVVIASAINAPIFGWCAVNGFMPQIFGMGFMAVSTIRVLYYREGDVAIKEIIQDAIIIAAFALAYSEMIPFFALIVMSVFIAHLLMKKNCKSMIKSLALLAAISVILIVAYIPGMVTAILSQMKAVVGWNQMYNTFDYLSFYLSTGIPEYHICPENMMNPKSIIVIIYTVIVLHIVIIGIKRIAKNRLRDIIIIMVPFFLLAVYFILSPNPFTGGRVNTWSLYKLVQYSFSIGGPIIGVLEYEALLDRKYLIICFIIITAIFSLLQNYRQSERASNQMKQYVGDVVDPIGEYELLKETFEGYGGLIEIKGDVPIKHRQLVTYYLRENNLISDWDTDDYYSIMGNIVTSNYDPDIAIIYSPSEQAIAGMILDLKK